MAAGTWVEVTYDSTNAGGSSSKGVLTQCATLLAINEKMPLAKFLGLLDPHTSNSHVESDGKNCRLFLVYAWAPSPYDPNTTPNEIEIVVAFYKSIRRSPKGVSTANGSKVTQRWWTITVGCLNPPGATDFYGPVRQKVVDFNTNTMPTLTPANANPAPQLVILDDPQRIPDPVNITADYILSQFLLDVTVCKASLYTTPPYYEPVYGAFGGTYLTGWKLLGAT